MRSKPEPETVLPTVQLISSKTTASVRKKNIIMDVKSEILVPLKSSSKYVLLRRVIW